MTKKKRSVANTIKAKRKKAPKFEPLWKGPEVDGITQSMISSWLHCREQTRIKYILGYTAHPKFRAALDYGHLWHCCEENLAGGNDWRGPLKQMAQDYLRRYPTQNEEINHWYQVCKLHFPIYVQYWKDHDDVKNRKPIYQEKVFKVPYTLRNGRTILLRGKWDSVDSISKKIWLQEDKTKSQVVEEKLTQNLDYDLQTMTYLAALREHLKAEGVSAKLGGIRYNVVRRPLSGGKGSIRRKKPTKANPRGESLEDYYERLRTVLTENAEEDFHRWKVIVTEADIKRFEHHTLNNVLEEIVRWYDWISSPAGIKDPFANSVHFRYPYGVYNPTLEGNATEYDTYLRTGSTAGLTRRELFQELQ